MSMNFGWSIAILNQLPFTAHSLSSGTPPVLSAVRGFYFLSSLLGYKVYSTSEGMIETISILRALWLKGAAFRK